MFQSLTLTSQRLVDRLFIKITIKKLISCNARLLVQQACNVFVSDILRKRIREFRAFLETLQELINSSFTTVAATFGNLASAEVIHEVKQAGADGYFDFVESYMGSQIKGTEMKFTIMSQM